MKSTTTGQKSKTDQNIYARIARDMRKIQNGLWDSKNVDRALKQLTKMGVQVDRELTVADYKQEVAYCSIWVTPELRLQFIVGQESAYPHWDTIETWHGTQIPESFWLIDEGMVRRAIRPDEVERVAEVISVLARMTPERKRIARSGLKRAMQNRERNKRTVQCPRCGRELECDARDAERGIKVAKGCEHCTNKSHAEEIWTRCPRCGRNYVSSFGPGDAVECEACSEKRAIMSRVSHP